MALPFGKKTKDAVESDERYTLAESPLPAALTELRTEVDRLHSLTVKMQTLYETQARVNLLDTDTRNAVLNDFLALWRQGSAPAHQERPVYVLMNNVGRACDLAAGQVTRMIERQEAQRLRQEQAAAEAERIRLQELAEIERIEGMFARAGKVFPPTGQ